MFVAVVLFSAACGVSRGGDAASVGFASGRSATVSGAELDGLVAEISASDKFVELAFRGTIPPELKPNILGLLILTEFQNEELSSRGIQLPPESIDRVVQELDGEILTGFENLVPPDPDPVASTALVSEEITNYLRAIAERSAGEEVLVEALLAEAEPQTQTVVCSRHILLASEAEALVAIERIAQGEEFEAVAMELSSGPSGPSGGDLGCSDPAGFVPEFAAAITDAPQGEVIGPVETQFGFHVIRVDGTETQEIPVNGQQLFFDVMGDLAGLSTVEVNELIGTWDPEGLSVAPPAVIAP